MRLAIVLQAAGWLIAIIAVAMAVPILTAVAYVEPDAVRAFALGVAIAGVSGGALIMGFRDVRGEASRSDLILLVVAGWTVTPAFAAVPFAALAAPTGVTDAYFEAVSGLTTTGATVLGGRLDDVPRAVVAWRAVLQWLGGLGTVVVAVMILAPLGIGGMELRRSPLARGDATSLVGRLRQTGVQVMNVYAVLTVLCFVLIWAGGVPGFDSFCLALSTVSTGGFLVREGSLAVYDAPISIAFVVLFMILGAASFAAMRAAGRGNIAEARADPEVSYLGASILIMGAALSLAVFAAGATSSEALVDGFFLAASFATTTGFLLSGAEDLAGIPPVLAMGVALIGGSTLSTAGGLKLMRLALLSKQVGRELKRLSHPHGIIPTRYAGRAVDIALMKDVWVFFILFLFVLILLAVIVSATGVVFEAALGAAAAALSNTGPAYAVVEAAIPGAVPYADFSSLAKFTLAAGMIIGRVEVFAFLSLFNIAYWRR